MVHLVRLLQRRRVRTRGRAAGMLRVLLEVVWMLVRVDLLLLLMLRMVRRLMTGPRLLHLLLLLLSLLRMMRRLLALPRVLLAVLLLTGDGRVQWRGRGRSDRRVGRLLFVLLDDGLCVLVGASLCLRLGRCSEGEPLLLLQFHPVLARRARLGVIVLYLIGHLDNSRRPRSTRSPIRRLGEEG